MEIKKFNNIKVVAILIAPFLPILFPKKLIAIKLNNGKNIDRNSIKILIC